MQDPLQRITNVDMLRGLAALGVLSFHYHVVRIAAGLDDPLFSLAASAPVTGILIRNGYLGVDLFFMITGFVLLLPWLSEANPAGSPRQQPIRFYANRARRIVPAYYVQLAFLLIVVAPLLGLSFDRWFLVHNWVLHLAFLHYTTPYTSASFSLNGALWTLTIEAQFYVLFPLLAPVFVRRPWMNFAAMLAVAALWRWQSAVGFGWLVGVESRLGEHWAVPEPAIRHLIATQLPGYAGHFACGMLAAHLFVSHKIARLADPWAAILALCASMLTLYWLYSGSAWIFGAWGWAIQLVALAGFFLAFLFVPCHSGFGALLARPLAAVGLISYSVYLYHLPLLLLFNAKTSPGLGSFPAFVTVVLLVATLSYRWIERPFICRGVEARRDLSTTQSSSKDASIAST
jgi:peptidoglycan/LPS O-acetylase OafA/YrhL